MGKILNMQIILEDKQSELQEEPFLVGDRVFLDKK
jgi:hypothetical protein